MKPMYDATVFRDKPAPSAPQGDSWVNSLHVATLPGTSPVIFCDLRVAGASDGQYDRVRVDMLSGHVRRLHIVTEPRAPFLVDCETGDAAALIGILSTVRAVLDGNRTWGFYSGPIGWPGFEHGDPNHLASSAEGLFHPLTDKQLRDDVRPGFIARCHYAFSPMTRPDDPRIIAYRTWVALDLERCRERLDRMGLGDVQVWSIGCPMCHAPRESEKCGSEALAAWWLASREADARCMFSAWGDMEWRDQDWWWQFVNRRIGGPSPVEPEPPKADGEKKEDAQ